VINRPGRCIVVAVTALALGGIVSVETALAKKSKIIATVNGKRVKFKGRYASTSTSDNGTITLGSKPGRVIRTLGFGCAVNLFRQTFPVTPPAEFCNGSYQETRNRGSSINGWLAIQGVNVTYESFNGTRATGSFSVTLEALTPSDLPPATIEGTFDTIVNQNTQ
jgi:hypothetical protein